VNFGAPLQVARPRIVSSLYHGTHYMPRSRPTERTLIASIPKFSIYGQ
jgi:hypothetical protein